MAGRPRQKVIQKWVFSHSGRDETPLDYICHRLSDGEFLEDIAAEIQRDTQWEIPQHALRRWLIDEFGKPEVLSRFSEARADAADAHVAKAFRILEDAPEVREALLKAKQKADLRIWMAERANRERYGPASAQAVNVTVNLAQLHADALRAKPVIPAATAVMLPAGVDSAAEGA